MEPPRQESADRAHSLPRLHPSFYQADAVVLWTLTTFDRAKGWLTVEFHHAFRELVMHTAAREALFCPAYVLMPDHIHLVWMGLRPDSDQRIGMAFLRTHLEPWLRPARFQPQAHDHVLKTDERRRNAFARICQYVFLNPVRGELVKRPQDWKFSGAIVPGFPRMDPFAEDFWLKFWKIYQKSRAAECDQHVIVRGGGD